MDELITEEENRDGYTNPSFNDNDEIPKTSSNGHTQHSEDFPDTASSEEKCPDSETRPNPDNADQHRDTAASSLRPQVNGKQELTIPDQPPATDQAPNDLNAADHDLTIPESEIVKGSEVNDEKLEPSATGQSSGRPKNADYTENGNVTLLAETPTTTTPITTPTDSATPGVGFSQEPRVFKRRWAMLMLFCLYSMSSAYQWIHLNIIANVLLRYYNESLPGDSFQKETAVDWLSMIYMLAYIPLIFPATWLLDKKGIRVCNIAGSCLNCAGAWLKCGSVGPGRFPLLMFSQTVCAVAQIFVLGIPARLAAVWFGPDEVATATSFGVFGNQIGVAIGFLIPPVLVHDSPDLTKVGNELSYMLYGGAAFTTVIFLAMIIIFQSEPPIPPSRAQIMAHHSAHDQHYLHSLSRLVRNWGFVILVVSYGINTGCYYAISTLLNVIVLFYFEGESLNAGRIGLTIILMGIVGSIFAGIWLDRTKMFKATSLGIYFMSMVGMLVFTFTVSLGHIWIVFLTAGSLGLFMTGYLPVGFEFAAEITFPEPEGTSSGLLNASAQFFGIIFTIGMRAMINKVSMLGGNLTASAMLLAGTVMTACIKPDYRRQAAGEMMQKNINQEILVEKSEKETSVNEPLTSTDP